MEVLFYDGFDCRRRLSGQGRFRKKAISGAAAGVQSASKGGETLETGGDPQALLPELLGKAVTCDEIGCGVVPIEPFEERWREETGRLCCALAARADAVYRVWACIPQKIK